MLDTHPIQKDGKWFVLGRTTRPRHFEEGKRRAGAVCWAELTNCRQTYRAVIIQSNKRPKTPMSPLSRLLGLNPLDAHCVNYIHWTVTKCSWVQSFPPQGTHTDGVLSPKAFKMQATINQDALIEQRQRRDAFSLSTGFVKYNLL